MLREVSSSILKKGGKGGWFRGLESAGLTATKLDEAIPSDPVPDRAEGANPEGHIKRSVEWFPALLLGSETNIEPSRRLRQLSSTEVPLRKQGIGKAGKFFPES